MSEDMESQHVPPYWTGVELMIRKLAVVLFSGLVGCAQMVGAEDERRWKNQLKGALNLPL